MRPDRGVEAALRERVKELECLYGIAQLVERTGISLEEILQGIVELLPPAWMHSDMASARIVLDGKTYATRGFRESKWRQVRDVAVSTEKRGSVEVAYAGGERAFRNNPFLKEEDRLMDTVARQIGVIVSRKLAETDRSRLQNQLRHADRLATIGQLAAGVAHELNEPLGSVLGFAQLARKSTGLPDQAARDIEKIEKASLHAREVVKKLMFFARRTPPNKALVNLNRVVEEGLYFLESRCAREGIELVRALSPMLPETMADPSQLTQVLVNLVVNAIQATPKGGRITVRTSHADGRVTMAVEDTGSGMTDEVLKQIFIPFFTTKDVHQGTGLGLPVVHGIVTAHGGTIEVESAVGRGSRFEVRLPAAAAT